MKSEFASLAELTLDVEKSEEKNSVRPERPLGRDLEQLLIWQKIGLVIFQGTFHKDIQAWRIYFSEDCIVDIPQSIISEKKIFQQGVLLEFDWPGQAIEPLVEELSGKKGKTAILLWEGEKTRAALCATPGELDKILEACL